MAKTTILRGYSDDIISLKGNVNEEFGFVDYIDRVIMLDDGTVFSIDYNSNGIWRFHIKKVGSKYTYTKKEATGDDDDINGDNCYSDIITISGDLKYAVFGELTNNY